MPTAKKDKDKPAKAAKPKKAKSGQGDVPQMPPAPTEAAAPARQPVNPNNLPVVYDRLSIVERSTTAEHGPLTATELKDMLGWETEPDFQARMVREKGGAPEHYLFGEAVVGSDGIVRPVHCRDTNGRKVVCWNNAGNRPFDQGWCEELIHTILYGQWAGPHTLPGETINGETVRVSRYGRVLSAQHSGTACILADEWLKKSRLEAGNAACPKYPAWNGQAEVFIEAIVVTGLSEDERVLQSIDYVRPRTLADMLYTMPTFRDNAPKERQELTRMLALAADLLWTRTKHQGYRTHLEMSDFIKRHPHLMKCVEHLFALNRPLITGGRKISVLRLSPGQCSALCYLMGSSGPGTDGDTYRNQSPPEEAGLDWSTWEEALDFWSRMASGPPGNDTSMRPVRNALKRLFDSEPQDDSNQGLGGRQNEKLAILAAAWRAFSDPDEEALTEDDLTEDGRLCLTYTNTDERGNVPTDGQIKLVTQAHFGGIDAMGIGFAAPDGPPPTLEELERLKEEAMARRRTR